MTPSRFLDPEGAVVVPLPKFTNNSPALVELYRGMILTRTFDTKAIALQRTGRLGTYASSLGQEAVAVGWPPPCGRAMCCCRAFASMALSSGVG